MNDFEEDMNMDEQFETTLPGMTPEDSAHVLSTLLTAQDILASPGAARNIVNEGELLAPCG
jgi:hypothetical protein